MNCDTASRTAGHCPPIELDTSIMNLITYLRAKYLRRLLRNESGQDLLEYALLVALIALVCVAVITSTGTNVQSIFSKISTELGKAATP